MSVLTEYAQNMGDTRIGAKPHGRGRARRDSLRSAAFELFSTVGFDETTTNATAKKAEVAAGTVFVHASDKVDLLHLVMHDLLADVVAERFSSLPTDGTPLNRPVAARLSRCLRDVRQVSEAREALRAVASGREGTERRARRHAHVRVHAAPSDSS